MPTYTAAQLRTELRNRTNDSSTNPYASDTQVDGFFTSASAKVTGAIGYQASTTQTGTGVKTYTIPSAVNVDTLSSVGVRVIGDHDTYQKVGYYIYGGEIFLSVSVPATQEILYRYERPMVAGDTISEMRFEAWVLAAVVNWCAFAMAHRADFEQWAATNRSDARIAEVRQLQSSIQSELERLIADIKQSTFVTNTQ